MQEDAFFLIGRRHHSDLEDSTQRDFLQLFGHMGKFNAKNGSFKFYKGGKQFSEVIFRHLDDLQSLTNMNLSGFWIDQAEEVDENAYDFLVGRIRRQVTRREGFITFNMDGHNWIWRRFLRRLGRDGRPLKNAEDYFLVTATTLENKKHLPKDYVDGLLAQPADYVKRFVYGSWDTFAGQVYDEFNPSIHILPNAFEIPDSWEKYRAIDHGQAMGHATVCLWAAVDFHGNIFIYKEYFAEGLAVSANAENINDLSKYRDPITGEMKFESYNNTFIDPSTHRKSQSKDGYIYSVADEYIDHGINTLPAQNDILAGVSHVKEYLKVNPEHFHPILQDENGEFIKGAPRLYIFPQCNHLIEELPQYRWKQYSARLSGNIDRDAPSEAPIKRNDNCVDTLRYIISSRPSSPESLQEMEAWVYANPLELARRASKMDLTVDDLLARRFGNTVVRHKSSNVRHSEGLGSKMR